MLRKLAYVLAVCVFEFLATNALPTGAPESACNNFVPLHGGSSSPLNYAVSSSNFFFSPGEVLTISLSRTGAPVNYRGILMQVRDENNEPSGTFSLPQGGQFRHACPAGMPGATITHTSRADKQVAQFMWTAPSSCDALVYRIRATVVNVFTSYEVGIMSGDMFCLSDDIQPLPPTSPQPPPVPTSTQLPPLPTSTQLPPVPASTQLPSVLVPGCPFPTTVVPANKYDTSFEEEANGGLNGWTNVDDNWTRRSGGTPSYDTGPNGAADGGYYMYFEASFPRRPGDRATLQSDQNLQGCFCLSFYRNLNIRNNSASLAVFEGDNNIFFSSTREREWEATRISVQTSGLTQIRFVYTRGRSFQADIAIDQLDITPGFCTDDSGSGFVNII